MQTLRSHKFGINQGLNTDAKELLQSATSATECSAIFNGDGQKVSDLHLVTLPNGQHFVEFVGRTVQHLSGLIVYFLSLTDRLGQIVPESIWSEEDVHSALCSLQESNTIDVAILLARGAAPPTSFLRH